MKDDCRVSSMKRTAPETTSPPSKPAKAPLLKSPSKVGLASSRRIGPHRRPSRRARSAQATTDGGDDESPARGGSAEEATQDFGVTQTQEFESCPPGSRKLQIFSYAAAEVVCSQYCPMPLPKRSAVSRVESRRVRRRLVAYPCDGTAVRCGSEAADAARQAEAREIVGLQRR